MSTIAENINKIYREIEETAVKCGRNPQDISLMAVSKTKPFELMMEAYEAGMRLFGENRVQEGYEKNQKIPQDAQIHMIGHLQSNKAKLATGNFSCIQSIDSLKIASKVNKIAQDKDLTQDVLIEIKTADEDYAKTGFSDMNEYYEAMEEIVTMKNLKVRGLMTIAPFVNDEMRIRQCFIKCREIFEETKHRFTFEDFDVLSMGMSGDFKIAIEEGATLIRVGSSIFGSRY